MHLAEELISLTVMRGNVDPQAVQEDLCGIDDLLALERSWYQGAPRYSTNRDVLRAAAAGELERIGTDENLKPALRFRNERLEHIYPPYLKPYAAATLKNLGILWRVLGDEAGIHPGIRLSVTSLTRSAAYQGRLVAEGKLAVLDSTHTAGATFDLDLSGYYLHDFYMGRDAVVSKREPTTHENIATAFRKDYGVEAASVPIRLGPEWFDQNVPDTLLAAAELMYGWGLINMVPEMVGSDNSALHIAAAPPWAVPPESGMF